MFKQPRLTFTLILALSNIISYPTLGQIQPNRIFLSQNPPLPPQTPPPPGNRKPGGSLSGSSLSCNNTNKQLIAIVPNDSRGATTSEHPTFWFYIPYTPEQIHSADFSLVTQDEKKRIYRTSFRLPATPGFVSISLPSLPNYALENGKFYHWYLTLKCAENTNPETNLVVDGWVERVAMISEGQSSTETPNIWYDTLTDLAKRRLASPQDEKLKNEWTNFLKSVGLEELSQEPLIGSVLPTEEE